jgi:hypothetical protein
VPSLPSADGRSQVPLIEAAIRGKAAPAADEAPVLFAQLDRRWGSTESAPQPIVAVTEGPYRLLVGMGTEEEEELELFDHRTDPGERQNIAEDQPDVSARLQKRVDNYLSRPPLTWGNPLDVEVSDLERGQLQALGYVVR